MDLGFYECPKYYFYIKSWEMQMSSTFLMLPGNIIVTVALGDKHYSFS